MKETNNRSKTDQNENDTTQFDRTNGVICHNAEHQTKTTAIQVNYTFQYCLHCGILKSKTMMTKKMHSLMPFSTRLRLIRSFIVYH